MSSDYERIEKATKLYKAKNKTLEAQEKAWLQGFKARRADARQPSLMEISDRTEKRFIQLIARFKVSDPTKIPERDLYVFFGDALSPSTLFTRKLQRIKDAVSTLIGNIYTKEQRRWEETTRALDKEYSDMQSQLIGDHQQNFESLLIAAIPVYTKFGYSYNQDTDTFIYTRGKTPPEGYKQKLVTESTWVPELLKLTAPVNFQKPNLFKKRPNLLVGGTRKKRGSK